MECGPNSYEGRNVRGTELSELLHDDEVVYVVYGCNYTQFRRPHQVEEEHLSR